MDMVQNGKLLIGPIGFKKSHISCSQVPTYLNAVLLRIPIRIEPTITFHKSEPKYQFLKIQILNPKSNIVHITQIQITLFYDSTP